MIHRLFTPKGLALTLVALVVVVLARLLRPLLLIRFGNLRNHTLGTYSLHAEGYLADRELGVLQPKSLDLFYHTDPRANRVLDGLIEQRLHVTPLAEYCVAVNARIPGGRAHICELGNPELDRQRDHHRAYWQTKPHLRLSDTQIAEARKILAERTGMPADARFICFFSRTSSYLQSLHKGGELRKAEDIPVSNIRDSHISTYLPAARHLADQGYWLFRMGAVVDEGIAAGQPRMVDYASTFRSELLDIYLMSHCHMVLADTTGLVDLSFCFRRNAARANVVNLLTIYPWGEVFIPKLFWMERQGRYMTLAEILDSGMGTFSSGEWDALAAQRGLTAHDNTAEEIDELAQEALSRYAGTWRDTPEDLALLRRADEIYAGRSRPFGGPLHARIAVTFLRRHPRFLE